MQIPGPTEIQIQRNWVAKVINLPIIKLFPEWGKSSGRPGWFCSLAVTFCSSCTILLEVHKHARPVLVLELYLGCFLHLQSSLLQIISTAEAFPSSFGRNVTSRPVLFWPQHLIQQHNTPPHRHPLSYFMSPSHNYFYFPKFYTVCLMFIFYPVPSYSTTTLPPPTPSSASSRNQGFVHWGILSIFST